MQMSSSASLIQFAGSTQHPQPAPADLEQLRERIARMGLDVDRAAREHDLQDVRCECCGYMTYHREHMGCIHAARAPAKTLEAATERAAERIDRGLNINLNHADYYTMIEPPKKD